jgi:hypothetical protein
MCESVKQLSEGANDATAFLFESTAASTASADKRQSGTAISLFRIRLHGYPDVLGIVCQMFRKVV